jgi:chromatin remodeling complex protein RSC6
LIVAAVVYVVAPRFITEESSDGHSQEVGRRSEEVHSRQEGGGEEERAGGEEGGPAKAAAKAPAKSAAKKSTAAKRAPNAAFMKAMTPSADLAAVVGNTPLPRTEVTKRVWEYIRKNNLQDAQNRRQINADESLRKVFGGKKSVTMFEMTKLVNQHLS